LLHKELKPVNVIHIAKNDNNPQNQAMGSKLFAITTPIIIGITIVAY
jgi:hypothetical protein